MTHEEALKKTQEYLHLVGKPFKLPDGETETVKAVVAWKGVHDEWAPHVCFYHWGESNPDGKITHMEIVEFLNKYQQI